MDHLEPNRTEQWLSEYARHRVAEFGEPPRMHEATRAMLQGEVRRVWSQPEPAPAASHGWEAIFLRWALSGVSVAGVLVLSLMFFKPPGRSGSREIARQNTAPNSPDNTSLTANVPSNKEQANGNIGNQPKISAAPHIVAPSVSVPSAGAPGDVAQEPWELVADFQHTENEALTVTRAQPQQIESVQSLGQGPSGLATPNRANGPSARIATLPTQLSQAESMRRVMRQFKVQIRDSNVEVRDQDGSTYSGSVLIAATGPVQLRPLIAQASGQRDPGRGVQGGTAGNIAPGTPLTNLPAQGTSPAVQAAQTIRPALAEQAPLNDNVANSWPISKDHLNRPIFGFNMQATSEGGREAFFRNFHGKSVWWRFTAPADGDLTIETEGSNFDTTLGVFKGGNVGDLSPLPTATPFWNDNVAGAPWSRVQMKCRKDDPFLIAVDGHGGATGQIKLTLRFQNARPVAAAPIAPTNPVAPGGAAAPTQIAKTSKNAVDKGAESVQSNPLLYFRVRGTNLSTQQLVDFDGFLYNQPSTDEKVEVSKTKAAERLRIQGNISIGDRELEMPIDATNNRSAIPQKALKQ